VHCAFERVAQQRVVENRRQPIAEIGADRRFVVLDSVLCGFAYRRLGHRCIVHSKLLELGKRERGTAGVGLPLRAAHA